MSTQTAEHTTHATSTSKPATPAAPVASTVTKEGTSGKVAEQPKPATTLETVTKDKATGADKSTPAPKAPPAIRKFRILDGVDAGKFRGQRKILVDTLQKLAAENHAKRAEGFTFDEIVPLAEAAGWQSKAAVVDSVKFHMAGMLKDKEVEEVGLEPAK